MRPWLQHRRAPAVAVAAVVVVVVALLWAFDPRTAGFFPGCPLFLSTGWQCPGCGTTRALHALVHGDIATAWAWNPLTMTLLVLGVVKLATPPLPRPWLAPLSAAVVVVAAVFGIARNLG